MDSMLKGSWWSNVLDIHFPSRSPPPSTTMTLEKWHNGWMRVCTRLWRKHERKRCVKRSRQIWRQSSPRNSTMNGTKKKQSWKGSHYEEGCYEKSNFEGAEGIQKIYGTSYPVRPQDPPVNLLHWTPMKMIMMMRMRMTLAHHIWEMTPNLSTFRICYVLVKQLFNQLY